MEHLENMEWFAQLHTTSLELNEFYMLAPFLPSSLLLKRIGSEFHKITWAEGDVWLTLALTLILTLTLTLTLTLSLKL